MQGRKKSSERFFCPVANCRGKCYNPKKCSGGGGVGLVLVADPSREMCEVITKVLAEQAQVICCHDGRQALEMVDRYRPQVLILELALPGLDGMGVLDRLETCPWKPAVLALSAFFSEYLIEKLTARADYILYKPMNMLAVKNRVCDLLLRRGALQNMPTVHTGAGQLLLSLGIPPTREGLSYLEAAVEYIQWHPDCSVTKQMYPDLARRFGSSPAAVEKAIRDAISLAWEHRNERIWRGVFSPGPGGLLPRPGNRQFLMGVAGALHAKQKQA